MNDFKNTNKNKISIHRDCTLHIISAIQMISNSDKP